MSFLLIGDSRALCLLAPLLTPPTLFLGTFFIHRECHTIRAVGLYAFTTRLRGLTTTCCTTQKPAEQTLALRLFCTRMFKYNLKGLLHSSFFQSGECVPTPLRKFKPTE